MIRNGEQCIKAHTDIVPNKKYKHNIFLRSLRGPREWRSSSMFEWQTGMMHPVRQTIMVTLEQLEHITICGFK